MLLNLMYSLCGMCSLIKGYQYFVGASTFGIESSTIKQEVPGSSDMLVPIHHCTHSHIQGDSVLYATYHKNIKFCHI